MGDKTGIEWTDASWNPVRGCSRVSQGCVNCYAERVANRFSGPGKPYEGLVNAHGRWNGTVRLVPEHLADPLRWRRPRRVFVNSMSDLFHENLSNEDIAAVFGVMAAAPQHTFQVLTKRPARAREWCRWAKDGAICAIPDMLPEAIRSLVQRHARQRLPGVAKVGGGTWCGYYWPLPNVWLGVSAENQATADERIPILLETPAAVRFVSYEPALGPIDFERYLPVRDCDCYEVGGVKVHREESYTRAGCPVGDGEPTLDWIIAGSESGPGARPAELDWYRSVAAQCAAAGVAFFMKQLVLDGKLVKDISRFPADLGAREWPI